MHYKYRQAGRARTHAHATQGTRAWHSCAHCGPSTRSCGAAEGPPGPAAGTVSRPPPVYGTTGPRLDNNHIHRETHNANRKDAAYYGGVSTRGSPRVPEGAGFPSFFCQRAASRVFIFFGRLWSAVESRHLHPPSPSSTPSTFLVLYLRATRLLSLFLHPTSFHLFLSDRARSFSPWAPYARVRFFLSPSTPTIFPLESKNTRGISWLTGWRCRYLFRTSGRGSYVRVEVYIAGSCTLNFLLCRGGSLARGTGFAFRRIPRVWQRAWPASIAVLIIHLLFLIRGLHVSNGHAYCWRVPKLVVVCLSNTWYVCCL